MDVQSYDNYLYLCDNPCIKKRDNDRKVTFGLSPCVVYAKVFVPSVLVAPVSIENVASGEAILCAGVYAVSAQNTFRCRTESILSCDKIPKGEGQALPPLEDRLHRGIKRKGVPLCLSTAIHLFR